MPAQEPIALRTGVLQKLSILRAAQPYPAMLENRYFLRGIGSIARLVEAAGVEPAPFRSRTGGASAAPSFGSGDGGCPGFGQGAWKRLELPPYGNLPAGVGEPGESNPEAIANPASTILPAAMEKTAGIHEVWQTAESNRMGRDQTEKESPQPSVHQLISAF